MLIDNVPNYVFEVVTTWTTSSSKWATENKSKIKQIVLAVYEKIKWEKEKIVEVSIKKKSK